MNKFKQAIEFIDSDEFAAFMQKYYPGRAIDSITVPEVIEVDMYRPSLINQGITINEPVQDAVFVGFISGYTQDLSGDQLQFATTGSEVDMAYYTIRNYSPANMFDSGYKPSGVFRNIYPKMIVFNFVGQNVEGSEDFMGLNFTGIKLSLSPIE